MGQGHDYASRRGMTTWSLAGEWVHQASLSPTWLVGAKTVPLKPGSVSRGSMRPVALRAARNVVRLLRCSTVSIVLPEPPVHTPAVYTRGDKQGGVKIKACSKRACAWEGEARGEGGGECEGREGGGGAGSPGSALWSTTGSPTGTAVY